MPDMTLSEAVHILHDARTDEIVVTTMGNAREWMTLPPHPLDWVYVPSSMGQATTLGLGLALSQPSRRVVVCNGDGCQLMNLGSLITITAQSPLNFTLILFDNGIYEVTGAQPLISTPKMRKRGDRIDWQDVLSACGFEDVQVYNNASDWRRDVKNWLQKEGPTCVVLQVAPVPNAVGPRSPGPAQERAQKFRETLTGT
ncbi:MAG: thiamine pyrophosphate-dependent enzyme [Planctomycetota bacterium]|nr:thiamine pyrophosphate-dependent enzyme [Planctomycetota bacterium]MDA1213058.1 thiamine pyrophosphate-dependent enzyme [Planctomycetota bacterium]